MASIYPKLRARFFLICSTFGCECKLFAHFEFNCHFCLDIAGSSFCRCLDATFCIILKCVQLVFDCKARFQWCRLSRASGPQFSRSRPAWLLRFHKLTCSSPARLDCRVFFLHIESNTFCQLNHSISFVWSSSFQLLSFHIFSCASTFSLFVRMQFLGNRAFFAFQIHSPPFYTRNFLFAHMISMIAFDLVIQLNGQPTHQAFLHTFTRTQFTWPSGRFAWSTFFSLLHTQPCFPNDL